MYKIFFLICFSSLAVFSTNYPQIPIKITQERLYNIFGHPVKNITIKFFSRGKRNSKFYPDVLGTIGKARFIGLVFNDGYMPLITISLANPNYQDKHYEIITLNENQSSPTWQNRSYYFMLDYNKPKYQELVKILGPTKPIHVHLLIKITYPQFEPISLFYTITCKGHKYETSDKGRLAKELGQKEQSYSFKLAPLNSLISYHVGNINLIKSNFNHMSVGLVKNTNGQFIPPSKYEIINTDDEEALDRMCDEQLQAIEKAEQEGVVFVETTI